MSQTRRLAAILAADVAGYSRLIEADEEGTLGRLKLLRAETIDPKIAGYRGRIVKTTGDGLLIDFASVVDALRCAAELQADLAEGNAALSPDRRIEYRIGINMGDIVVEDSDIFGDGVNVAARLEGHRRSHFNGIGFVEIPGITDAADKKVPEDLARNLPVAMGNVFRLIEVLPTAESSHDTPKQCRPLQGKTMKNRQFDLSYFSTKVEKRTSPIDGRGLFAKQAIKMGEIAVVKGGYVLTRAQRDQIGRELGPADIQITEDLFIGPVTRRQREGGMMHLNHSCEPNLGLQGQVVFLSLRDIEADEELTFDYAMTDDEPYEMKCQCGMPNCRGTITGSDWRKPEIQNKYDGYFSWFIQRRIDALKRKEP